jgi:lycopene cyclase CruA
VNMNYCYTDYVELSAPIGVVRSLLADETTWAALPLGAERLHEFWCYAGELYAVSHQAEAAALVLEITPASGTGSPLRIEIELHDAVIATHVLLRVQRQGWLWPWERVELDTRLRRFVQQSVALFTSLLQAEASQFVLEPLLATAPVAVGAAANHTISEEREAKRLPTGYGHHLADSLAARYPQTVEHFAAMNAFDHLERVWRLEQGWEQITAGQYDTRCYQLEPGPAPLEQPEYDLIYAGGGLGLLHAAVMAKRYNRRVLVFDRGEVGCAHREWNISRPELQALVDLGVIDWDDLRAVVMREYRDGLVRFYNGPFSDVATTDLWLPDVLNVALDAGALLRLMRQVLEQAGGTVLDHRAFRLVRTYAEGQAFVELELEQLALPGMIERYTGRMLLDGMGSTSPLSLLRHAGRPFAGVCPTVGTVARGFAQGSGPQEYDPTVGDILLSVADAQHGEQLMWEGFPGRDDELTVYLFYYSTLAGAGSGASGATTQGRSYSLLELFEQYFALLPTYKRAGPHFRHLKPVYGYIPARHSLRSNEVPLLRGVLPVGDSAAQQSPLTFCGFGSHVRNLDRTTSLLNYALDQQLLDAQSLRRINAFQVNVSLNWVFSRFMHPWAQPHTVNRLQNIFLDTLNELGVEAATRFFQDRMRWSDYHPMIFGTLRRFRQIIPISWRVLGPRGWLQWASDYGRFSGSALQASLARLGGRAGERSLRWLADRLGPRAGLLVRAKYAEWRAMGWVHSPDPKGL